MPPRQEPQVKFTWLQLTTTETLEKMPQPKIRHIEHTSIFSLDDEPWKPTQRLFDLAADIARIAPTEDHAVLRNRNGGGAKWYEVFPGEHYNLLTSTAKILNAKNVWEFGTDLGMSTVALMCGMPTTGCIHTVDIDPWLSKPGTWLIEQDFESGMVKQIVTDMQSPLLFSDHNDSLCNADLLFVDGPKDGHTEAAFLRRLSEVDFKNRPIIIFDDIRLENMVYVWRTLDKPKMDLTS